MSDINKSALLQNEEMDWSINYTLKLICAIIFGAVSFVLWIGYSTPNTINVAIVWMGKVILALGLFNISGSFIGWIIGLSISFLEYGSMLGYLWKKRWYFIFFLLLTMFISIYGSYKFNQFSEQSNKLKEDTIGAHENLVSNYNNLIATQDSTIAGQNHYISSTLSALKRKYIVEQGSEPDWISYRERKALEAIERATYLKQVYSDSLNKYTFKTIGVKKETGYIVKLSDSEAGSSRGSLIGAIIIEILLVSCGFISIAFFSSSIQDSKRGVKSVPKSVNDSVPKTHQKVSTEPEKVYYGTPGTQGTPQPVAARHGYTEKAKFGFQVTGDTNKKRTPSKLQSEIIEVYEEYKKRGLLKDMKIKQIAQKADRSRQFVYKTLYAFTDFQSREKTD